MGDQWSDSTVGFRQIPVGGKFKLDSYLAQTFKMTAGEHTKLGLRKWRHDGTGATGVAPQNLSVFPPESKPQAPERIRGRP